MHIASGRSQGLYLGRVPQYMRSHQIRLGNLAFRYRKVLFQYSRRFRKLIFLLGK